MNPEDFLEIVKVDGVLLAFVFRQGKLPDKSCFVTPDEANFQMGFVVHSEGAEVKRHAHQPVTREIVGTAEVAMVRSGRCEVDVYDTKHEFVRTIELSTGDTMLLLAGGHGFRMLEDTVLMEIKQGPYVESEDKINF